MKRRRVRLVPENCVEAFEFRVVLYFDPEGNPFIDWAVSRPDDPDVEDVPTHEIAGVAQQAIAKMFADQFSA